MLSSVAWGVIISLGTIVLSFLHVLNASALLGFWLAIAILLAVLIVRLNVKGFSFIPRVQFDGVEKILVGCVAFIVIVLGLNACLAAPNTSDSINYHMSRIMHWLQNESLAYYPTHVLRQLYLPPWAEWAMMHLQALNQGDLLANLVQWFSYLGSLLGISLIARQIGASRFEQVFTVVIAAVIPMGILQSTSTQNDLVVTYWTICLIYFLMRHQRDKQRIYLVAAALSLALGATTKALIFIIAAPFLVPYLIVACKVNKVHALQFVLIGFAALLFFAGPMIIMNRSLGWGVMGWKERAGVTVERVSAKGSLVLLARNVMLHFGSSNKRMNETIENSILKIHQALDYPTEDPQIFYGGHPFKLQGQPFHEDHAGNPLHVIFILICSVFLIAGGVKRRQDLPLNYFYKVCVAFILFCLLIKWQPWHTRMQTPIFFLCAPFMAMSMSRQWPRPIVIVMSFVFFLSGLPWVFANTSRPLIGATSVLTNSRQYSYFANYPTLQSSVNSAVASIEAGACFDISLIANEGAFEYPFWPLLKKALKRPFRFEHVRVENVSGKLRYPLGEFDPCSVISLMKSDDIYLTLGSSAFVRTGHYENADVYLKNITGDLALKNLFVHLNKMIELAKQDSLYKPGGDKSFSDIIKFRREELLIIENLDKELLNNLYPELGDHLKNEYYYGLMNRLLGFVQSNEKQYLLGEMLIAKWNSWFNAHLDGIKSVL